MTWSHATPWKSIRIREDEWQAAKLASTSRKESIRAFVERAIRNELLVASVGPLPMTRQVRGVKRGEKRKIVSVSFEGEGPT